MGVRLYKVFTELNIGLQTVIDFLNAKPELGGIKENASVNTKISDEQYEALKIEFQRDKEILERAHTIFPPKIHYGDNVNTEDIEEAQTFTPLGHIDVKENKRHSDFVFKYYDQALKEIQTDNKEQNEYTVHFLNSYKEALHAYKKAKWNDWVLKGRQSIENFCRYYIYWLCDEDERIAKDIIDGKRDFENNQISKDRYPLYGKKMIETIYQENGEKLESFLTEKKLYSAYASFSEFVHNTITPNTDNTKSAQYVIEKLYSIFKWTENRKYSEIIGASRIRVNHSALSFINSQGKRFSYRIGDIILGKGSEGDHMITFDNKYQYFFKTAGYYYYSEDEFRRLIKHDWIQLHQKGNRFVYAEMNEEKYRDELNWGLSEIKVYQKEISEDLDMLYQKIKEIQNLHYQCQESKEFVSIYEIMKHIVPSIPLVINGNDFIAIRESVRAEDDNYFWGDDAKIKFKGINYQRELVEKCYKLKITSDKNDIIKKINSHDYQRLGIYERNNENNVEFL